MNEKRKASLGVVAAVFVGVVAVTVLGLAALFAVLVSEDVVDRLIRDHLTLFVVVLFIPASGLAAAVVDRIDPREDSDDE